MMGDQSYAIETLPAHENLEKIEATWRQLTDNFPHSYFLSWGWMESWLASQQDTSNILCIFGYRDSTPCFGFFVGYNNYRKYGFYPTRSAHLNATGKANKDIITIEYNGILSAVDSPPIFPSLLFSPPLKACNEFVFPGTTGAFATMIRDHCKNFYLTTNEQLSYYTDLSLIRGKNGDYLSILSSNKRQQIRRSIKEYEKGGMVQCQHATSSGEAETMFDEMGELHTEAWRKRGKNGSFVSAHWVHFHKTLIRNRFSSGEIHISKIFTQEKTLGYIYGFIYNDTFLFCQCGFHYEKNNKLRPGIVSHYILIQYFAERGLALYDFLAGDSDYKRSLSTNRTAVYWLALQRRTAAFAVIKTLKDLVRTGGRFLTTAMRPNDANAYRPRGGP
ncbi:MAG: GNAT family N-acetyltransferase [Cellvibrionaceae bacterium]